MPFYFISFDCKENREDELKKLITEAVSWMRARKEFEKCYHGTYKVCSGGPWEYEIVFATNEWGVIDRLDEKLKTYITKFCELTKNRTIVIGEQLSLLP